MGKNNLDYVELIHLGRENISGYHWGLLKEEAAEAGMDMIEYLFRMGLRQLAQTVA